MQPPSPGPQPNPPQAEPGASDPTPAEDPPVAGPDIAGPDAERMKADLRDGMARMKGLIEQLRCRLDRRREPREK